MTHSCDVCRHNHVCKFQKDFKKFSEDVELLTAMKPSSDTFEVSVTCKFYQAAYEYPFGEIQTSPYVITTKGTNPCEYCFNNPKWAKDGIRVGDSPCEWCPNSPLRVTCNTTGSIGTATTSYTINSTGSQEQPGGDQK